MRYAYLAVEGPHDVEFVGRLLRPYGFRHVRLFDQLDKYWEALVPRRFPYKGDMTRRVPVPAFFTSSAVSVAIHAAGGDSEIVHRVEETLLAPLPAALDAVGILLDADTVELPEARFNTVRAELTSRTPLLLPAQPGEVSTATPRCGVFVLPDNQSQGTLEDLLLEAASLQYPGLLSEARALVKSAQSGSHQLTVEDSRELNKPAGPKKAAVACIASVLKPGKSIQVSLQDNRWLEGASLQLSRIAAVNQFLRQLLDLT